MPDRSGSRVARTAALVATADQDAIRGRLGATRALIELEERDADAATCLLAAVRQAVLMWGDVTVSFPDGLDLAHRCRQIADELRPGQSSLRFDPRAQHADFDGVLHIGPTASTNPKVVAVTHTGWVLHMFAPPTVGECSTEKLPTAGPPNPLAAIGASALGLGEVFLRTLGVPRSIASFDLSLLHYELGPLDSLPIGPALPTGLDIEGFLVGAGTVGAGFAFALSPIDVHGWLALVDHDAARQQNFGPHLYVSTETNGTPKVKLLELHLKADHPALKVIPKAERFRLFRHRLGTMGSPRVVVGGLDKARPRQEVQRLWAPLHIDMATKDGLQVQVLVRTVPGTGLCLIRRFPIGDEPEEEVEIRRRTGLSDTALCDELADVTEEDIAAAPEKTRWELTAARVRGERRCNVITRADLGTADDDDDDYVGSAPFTALLAGVFAVAELIKAIGLGLDRDGVLVMWHYVSRNLYVDRTRCADDCECAAHTRLNPVDDR
jgi:hypothetical protein